MYPFFIATYRKLFSGHQVNYPFIAFEQSASTQPGLHEIPPHLIASKILTLRT